MFENGWNSNIGKRYVPYGSTLLSITGVVDGKHERKIALLIKDERSVLLSWRYVSEQAKCAAYYYSPGA